MLKETAFPTHHPVFGLSVMTTFANAVLFCHNSVLAMDHSYYGLLLLWTKSCAHSNTALPGKWSLDAPRGCRHRNFPVSVSHLSFLRASFSLSNLSLWVLPPDISRQRSRVNKNTLLWFLAHFHHDWPDLKRGDGGYSPVCLYRFPYLGQAIYADVSLGAS